MGGVVTGDTCYPTTSVGAYRDSTQAFTIPPEGKLKLWGTLFRQRSKTGFFWGTLFRQDDMTVCSKTGFSWWLTLALFSLAPNELILQPHFHGNISSSVSGGSIDLEFQRVPCGSEGGVQLAQRNTDLQGKVLEFLQRSSNTKLLISKFKII